MAENPSGIMMDMFRKVTQNSNKITVTEIAPELKQQEELSRPDREEAIIKMKEELEVMEKELKILKDQFSLEFKAAIVYPCRSDLLSNYIIYSTLQTKVNATRHVLRIRQLPLEQRIKETGGILMAIENEDKAASFMNEAMSKLAGGDKFVDLMKEIEEEKKKGKVTEEPTYSRRINKKDPKIEVKVTKTDKKAVFSVVMEDDEDIPEVEEQDGEDLPEKISQIMSDNPKMTKEEEKGIRKTILDILDITNNTAPTKHKETLDSTNDIQGEKKDTIESKK